MSDWEDLCGDMGWANDESAFDKLIDFIEEKDSKSFSNRRNQQFTPEQKRDYAIKKAEERRLLSTPIAQYVVSRWGAHNVASVQERVWNENGNAYKSMHFELYHSRGRPTSFLTITKCNDLSYCVKFCHLVKRWNSTLCAEAWGNRLNPRLIEQAIDKYNARLNGRRSTK